MLRRATESAYEIVVDARPSGPPLTSVEHALQATFVVAFLGALVAEAMVLWHLWSLWA